MLQRFYTILLYSCLSFALLGLTGCSTIASYIPVPDFGFFGSDDPSSGRGEKVAKTARKQVGIPYRYGGTTPRGFDCSGLIWWSYLQHGVKIPRISEDQLRAGKKIRSRKSIKHGDIVVFKTGRGRSGLHTGLYVGNNQFIHAPTSGKRVRLDSLNNVYWSPRLIAIRRILS